MKTHWALWLTLSFLGCADSGGAKPPGVSAPAPRIAADFDGLSAGALPEGWRIGGTKQVGALASWSLVADGSPSSPPNVLALTAAAHGSSATFNLCWDERSHFQDGVLELALRADAGEEDQGGGPLWRLRDADNYYVCRVNPLESNFRLYVVHEGVRKQLATVATPSFGGVWLRVRVEHVGARIACILNGEMRLEAEDATLPEAGRVGLWTKADALTSFDDLVVRPAP